MSKKLVTVSGQFIAVDQVVTLNIPNLSVEAALRLSRTPPAINIVMIADTSIQSTHPRNFMMIADSEDLPANFVKYIGTFPFGPNKITVHVVEVEAQ